MAPKRVSYPAHRTVEQVGEAIGQLVGFIVTALIVLYGLALILGQHRLISRGGAAAARCAGQLVVDLLRMVVLVLVNTLTFLFRVLFHIGRPEEIANDFARWVERIFDVSLRR